jgi:hypothetical protein
MVVGMTPLMVKAGFVSAVPDAGYHIELAGGGHYNAAALCSKVGENPCWCWHHVKFFIYQCMSGRPPTAIMARNAQGGSSD